ncbi:MAG: efflux RND transporter periplasmic adaptor subunit, partial [Gammaproteobacteria bacterium]
MSGNIVNKESKSHKQLLTVLLLIIIAGVVIWAATRPDPVAVSLHAIEHGLVESTVSNTRVGTVKACRRAFLAPATGGEVANLIVKEGSEVKKNQLLMEVWNRDLKAKVTLEEVTVGVSKIRVEEICALADGAGREAKRLLGLQKREIVSEEQVDLAVTAAQAKRAACRVSKATVQMNEARLVVAQAMLERTRVKAPFDGIVAEVNVELGEFVTPSPPGIATLPAIDLLDMSCLYVSAPIDEVDAPQISEGLEVCVTLDAFPERRCSGVVRRIAPYVLDREKQARTVEVEVEIHSADELQGLLPGYSADIEILIER